MEPLDIIGRLDLPGSTLDTKSSKVGEYKNRWNRARDAWLRDMARDVLGSQGELTVEVETCSTEAKADQL